MTCVNISKCNFSMSFPNQWPRMFLMRGLSVKKLKHQRRMVLFSFEQDRRPSHLAIEHFWTMSYLIFYFFPEILYWYLTDFVRQFRSTWCRRLQQHLLLSGQSSPRPEPAQPDRSAKARPSTQHLHSSRYSGGIGFDTLARQNFIYFFFNWDSWILIIISDKRYS